jgi:hypothetical protein
MVMKRQRAGCESAENFKQHRAQTVKGMVVAVPVLLGKE